MTGDDLRAMAASASRCGREQLAAALGDLAAEADRARSRWRCGLCPATGDAPTYADAWRAWRVHFASRHAADPLVTIRSIWAAEDA